MNEAIVIDTPEGISYVRLASLKGMVKMEKAGLKGRVNATAMMRKEFGLKARAPHDEVIAAIQKKMNEILAAKQ